MSDTPITSQGHVPKETVTVIVSVGGFYQDNHQFLFKTYYCANTIYFNFYYVNLSHKFDAA